MIRRGRSLLGILAGVLASAACDPVAHLEPVACGNSHVEPGEQCDDGNLVEGDGCDSNCTFSGCGNEIVDPGEQCDDDNLVEGDGCDSNCTFSGCGNGVVDPGEQCDDGNTTNGDGCDVNCTLPRCGNGIKDHGEQCDDGNAIDGDGCDSNCTLPDCGNGVLDRGEQCDDSNTIDGDGCEADCTLPACGNGVVDRGEQCDDGNAINGDGCEADCTMPACGNAIKDEGEQCDDGNTLNGDACDANCTLPGCGNGIVDAGEECDDGNASAGDDCDATCKLTVSGRAYSVVTARTLEVRNQFFVFRDQDAGVNHGLPSGLFASSPDNLATIHIDAGCIDDPEAANGCSADPDKLDRVRGTVLQIRFDPQSRARFAGVNIEEPEHYGADPRGVGFDLRGATTLVFDVRAPQPMQIQISFGRCTTTFFTVPQVWTEMRFALSALDCSQFGRFNLANIHQPFGVTVNDASAPRGGTVLFDNVRLEPVPTRQRTALGFPRGNVTFGVLPRNDAPIPSDQVLRNLTTTYETSLAEIVLLDRGSDADLVAARLIADALHAALHHDNHGDPLPTASDGSTALHNGSGDGELALLNAQGAGSGQAGDIRLAGFTASGLCPLTGFCVLLDGATGGNNAFAIFALVAAFERFHDARYLLDAETIGRWLVGTLADRSGRGYDGYAVGFADGSGSPKTLLTGKSVENNADIFAALTELARLAAARGDTASAASWTAFANLAGDFVMQMYDAGHGRFFAGTAPVGTPPTPGLCLDGPVRGNEQINTCDFIDANTFIALAMAGSPRYRDQIDWRLPIRYSLTRFATSATVAGELFDGFGLIPPAGGTDGVAWEFTGQMVVAMRYVDDLYSQTEFEPLADHYLAEIRHAQSTAPFHDGAGVVASTLRDGDALRPIDQCLVTPFQCIPERIGLAATTWAILADRDTNPFPVGSP